MTEEEIRLAHKAAIKARDWATAANIVRGNPNIFGHPPPGVPDEIACLANDPAEPEWMLIKWSVQENDCQGLLGCRPYIVRSRQADHLDSSVNPSLARAWFDDYVARGRASGPGRDQIGETYFLVQVVTRVHLTDFNGDPIPE